MTYRNLSPRLGNQQGGHQMLLFLREKKIVRDVSQFLTRYVSAAQVQPVQGLQSY